MIHSGQHTWCWWTEHSTHHWDDDGLRTTEVNISSVRWQIDEDIEKALSNRAIPSQCPPDKMYVPEAFRTQLITWAHSSLTAGHPGETRTHKLASHFTSLRVQQEKTGTLYLVWSLSLAAVFLLLGAVILTQKSCKHKYTNYSFSPFPLTQIWKITS